MTHPTSESKPKLIIPLRGEAKERYGCLANRAAGWHRVSIMQGSEITLAIVEDDPAVRESLSILLRSSGIAVVGEFPTGEALLEAMQKTKLRPQIVLLDLELPGMHGVDLLKVLRKGAEPPEVVVLTVFDDRESLFSALQAGASGYILKDTPNDALCRAIEEVAAGGAPMSPAIARRVLQAFKSADDDLEPLSRRESEVLQTLVKGYTYEEIGAQLFISAGTVQAHLKKVYRKLGVNSRSAAVAKALRNRLVD